MEARIVPRTIRGREVGTLSDQKLLLDAKLARFKSPVTPDTHQHQVIRRGRLAADFSQCSLGGLGGQDPLHRHVRGIGTKHFAQQLIDVGLTRRGLVIIDDVQQRNRRARLIQSRRAS